MAQDCLSAETHARMVLAVETREGPNTQHGTEHLMAVSRFLFEGIMTTFHQTCITGEVSHGVPSLRRAPTFQEDEAMFREAFGSLSSSPTTKKHMRLVLALEPREGPNTQDQLGVSWRRLATTSRT